MRLNNGLLRQSVASGGAAPIGEVLSLAAAVEAILISATLHSRELGGVQDRRKLWSEIAQLFAELCNTWADAGSDDPSVSWLHSRLEHFKNLAGEQSELYVVTLRERLRHAKNRADVAKGFGQRNEIVPAGYRNEPGQSGPAHVYQLGH